MVGTLLCPQRQPRTIIRDEIQANSAKSKGCITHKFHAVANGCSNLNVMSKAQAGNDSHLKNVPLKLGGQQWLVVDIVCLLLLFVIYNGYQGDQLCRHL